MTNLDSLTRSLHAFDPDAHGVPALAMQLDLVDKDVEQPLHMHRKGQLVLVLRGAVSCEVPQALWMVPPQHAVWIPGGLPHSNRATGNARLQLLFIEPGAAPLPETCCTLAISPLLRELIVFLAGQGPDYPPEGPTARLVAVLLEQLACAPVARLHLPVSDHPKLHRLTALLLAEAAPRLTLAQAAARLAMGERSLARLVQRETGLSFGRWRQQLQLLIALRQFAAGDSVQAVAGQLGYDSVTAFITMFKKALGQSPTRYFAGLRA